MECPRVRFLPAPKKGANLEVVTTDAMTKWTSQCAIEGSHKDIKIGVDFICHQMKVITGPPD